MSFLDGVFRPLTASLLTQLGTPVTLTARADAGYIPGTGAPVTAPPTIQTGHGVVDAYATREIDGTRVRAGDVRLILGPLDGAGEALTAPEPGGKATIAGTSWSIVAVEQTAPAGAAVLYTLQLRK